MNATAPLPEPAPSIELGDVKKAFYTDEGETHALSDVHFQSGIY